MEKKERQAERERAKQRQLLDGPQLLRATSDSKRLTYVEIDCVIITRGVSQTSPVTE